MRYQTYINQIMSKRSLKYTSSHFYYIIIFTSAINWDFIWKNIVPTIWLGYELMYEFFWKIDIISRAKTKIYEKELCNLVILHIHGLKVNVNGRQTFNTFFVYSGFIIKFYHCWYIIKIRFQFMSHLSAITLVRENRENINI